MTFAILVLVAGWALPIGLIVGLTICGRWMWAATVAAGFAVPHQLLGLTSTCTQGADGTFGSRAVLSGPLLLIALGSTLWALHQKRADRVASWATLALPLILLVVTQAAWINTLRYGTPCGGDFADYGPSSAAMILIILASYLVLPLLLAITAAASVMMTRRLAGAASK